MPMGDESILPQFLDFVEWMCPHVYGVSPDIQPLTVSEYLKHKPASVRLRIRDADLMINRQSLPRHKASSTLFVKSELRSACPKPKPRVINNVESQSPLILGLWFARIAQYIKTNKVFGYGYFYKPEELNDWFQDITGLVYRDFGTFDLSLVTVFFRAESALFRHFGMPTAMINHIYQNSIKWSSCTRHRDDCNFAFTVKGRCRQSGDAHTSLCNNHLAIMAHLFAFAIHVGERRCLPRLWYKTDSHFCTLDWLRMLNNGDDNVCASRWPQPPPEIYPRFGLNISVESSYCKMTPVYDGKMVRLIRDPADFLVRFSFSRHFFPSRLHCLAALHGNCICFSHFVDKQPLSWALVRGCFRLCNAVKPSFSSVSSHTLMQLFENMGKNALSLKSLHPPTPLMRENFEVAFGLSVRAQCVFEQWALDISSLDDEYSEPEFDTWLRDCCKY